MLVKAVLLLIFTNCRGTWAAYLLFLIYDFTFLFLFSSFEFLFTCCWALAFSQTSAFPLSALCPWFNTRHLQPAPLHISSPETFALWCSHTLMLSHPLCVLLPPHTIPCVSLVCSCTESLSQLSLYGLKLPGQVYSTVSPCAAGPGWVESAWILSQPPTQWHRWPHFTIPSPYTRTKIFPAGENGGIGHIGALLLLLTFTLQPLVLFFCNVPACFGYKLYTQAENEGMQCYQFHLGDMEICI